MDFVGLVAIVMVFSIPLAAIWTSYKLKLKKFEAGAENNNLNDLKRQLGQMMSENELQREKIKTLEHIVSKLPDLTNEDKHKLKISLEENEFLMDDLDKWNEMDINKNKNKLF